MALRSKIALFVVALSFAAVGAANAGATTAKLDLKPIGNDRYALTVGVYKTGYFRSGVDVAFRLWGDDEWFDDLLYSPLGTTFGGYWTSPIVGEFTVSGSTLNEDWGWDEIYVDARLYDHGTGKLVQTVQTQPARRRVVVIARTTRSTTSSAIRPARPGARSSPNAAGVSLLVVSPYAWSRQITASVGPRRLAMRSASSSLMVSFASADAERRARRVPGRSVLTASPRAAATADVDVAAVAARPRPAAARVLDAAGGLLQADEKACSSSLRLVGVSLTERCVAFGVKTCVLLP